MSKRFLSCILLSVFAVVLVLFNSMEIWAATTGKIAGRVVDASSGAGLPGANIRIIGTTLGASADQQGNYFILNVPPGTFTVSATFMGYEKLTKTEVQVIVNRTTTIDFAIKQTAIQGVEITVTAERPIVEKDVTATEQVVNAADMAKSWVRTIPEVLETQTGVFGGQFRGGSALESVYMLDNVSLNSGLVSDNFTGLNTSTIQEISVLTGGYNAEYGNARSAIVNVVTKEGTAKGIHGTVITRMRPAGKYHYGRNIYSKDNYDWTHYNLDYWQEQVQPGQAYEGQNPDELLAQWQKSITPNSILADYADRAEYETEATLFGSVGDKLGVMLSGRFKRGVGIFPQLLEYNPEHNIQGKLTYNLTHNMKLKFSTIIAGYESADPSGVGFDTYETAVEHTWYPMMVVTDPYASNKYRLQGSFAQWPEKRNWNNYSLTFSHVLSPKTYYDVTFSYLSDKMDRSDRGNVIFGTNKWSQTDDKYKLVEQFLDEGYQRAYDKTESAVYHFKTDLTSQVNRTHLLKAGLEFKSYDFSYRHFLGTYEGSSRWNLCNVYDGTPYEGALYTQDKIEFAGMIVNAGLRLDFFNQNRNAANNMFDPLAFETTTKGHVAGEANGIPGNPERTKTKMKAVLAPRLGISHPISENTVLHFVYGHFYQRPSWSKMFGFPFIDFTEDMSKVMDPFAKKETYMDQWQGYLGNPLLDYERTIQYEIGLDENIADKVLLVITGYYKDVSNSTQFGGGDYWGSNHPSTYLYPQSNFYNITRMVSNSVYSDVRGIETKIDSRLRFPLNLGISHDVFWQWSGATGFNELYEPLAHRVNSPKGLANDKGAWSGYHKIKTWANLYYAPGQGPELAGMKPLGDVNIYVYFWWRSGQPYTYHGPGDTSTKPNNKRWFSEYETNLKIAKGFRLVGVRTELSVDIRNLFNNKFYNLLSGDDLIRWQEEKKLPEKERLPKHWFSNEPNVWGWYDMSLIQPRMAYFQLKFDF
jgi:hypothetical protein